jgi:hypothetical protein
LPNARLTPAERAHVEHQALMAGLSAAEFVRRCVLSRQIMPRRTRIEDAAVIELVRVGNNLNQMARSTHCGYPPAVSALRAALAELRDVLDRLSPGGGGLTDGS